MRLFHLASSANESIYAWARRLIDDLNRVQAVGDYPVFADDTAAGAGNVRVGEPFVTPEGVVRRRMV